MAQPSTEVNRIRQQVTQLTDVYSSLGGTLQHYADYGPAFFAEHLGTDDAPATDITPAEFHAAMSTLAAIVTGLTEDQRKAIILLRI